MSDKFSMSVGLAHDLELAFRRTGWEDPEEVKKLAKGDTLRLVREVVHGRAEIRPVEAPMPGAKTVTITIDPATTYRYVDSELISDIEYEAGEVALELCEFLNRGESSVPGIVMAERAVNLGANMGQRHAEALLENQSMIPKEWRCYWIYFPGTVRQGLDGGRRVACLRWDGCCWCLSFSWLERGYGSRGRLLRPRK